MDEVKCETCPIRNSCPAYCEADNDNDYSYHPKQIVRVPDYSCPLLRLIKAEALTNIKEE